MEKVDRRVIRTKRAIKNSFAMLLTQKKIEKITIKEICENADINRKTFYSYFTGTDALLESIEDELVAEYKNEMKELDVKAAIYEPRLFFEKLNQLFNNDFEFFGHLMLTSRNDGLMKKIIDALKTRIKPGITELLGGDEATAKLVIDYSIEGMVAVYRDWFASTDRPSLEELSVSLRRIMFMGANDFLPAPVSKRRSGDNAPLDNSAHLRYNNL